MSLKTLKDITFVCENCAGWNIDTSNLKQEAIKWIKNWKEINNKAHSNEIYAFESFFNIKESDLK